MSESAMALQKDTGATPGTTALYSLHAALLHIPQSSSWCLVKSPRFS